MKSLPPNDQSTQEPDHEERNSVFDFLYYDATRISAFLAQFEASGSLTQIVTTERAHRSKKEVVSTQAGGSAGFVKGTITDGTDVLAEYGQQSNKTYDTRWVNALAFLDYIDQRQLLRRDLTTSGIGDLVIFSGSLSLFDLGILKKVWDMPAVKKTMINGIKGQDSEVSEALSRSQRRRTSHGNKPSSKAENEAEMAIELLSVLPHSIQASVSDVENSVWCTFREDSITITPSDLFMKHGLSIGEDWNIVGVLDATPDIDYAMDDGTPFEIAKQLIAGSKLGMLALMMGPALVPAIRAMLGRPGDAYGVTPLLVFRSISSRKAD